MESIAVILLAAGSSTRMGMNKLSFACGGVTPLERCLDAVRRVRFPIASVAIAVSSLTQDDAKRLQKKTELPVQLVWGGATRGQSVFNALREVSADIVVIHDAARCLVTPALIEKSIESAIAHGSGVLGVAVNDTVRNMDGEVLNREKLIMTQTPQTFAYDRIFRAYESAMEKGVFATDDCAVYELYGYKAAFVEGDMTNQKLTSRSDIAFFKAAMGAGAARVGYGEDTHALAPDRKLVLGGVEIPFTLGLLGHSDADALVHSIMDALLGAAALGDIGRHFPDTDGAYKGICSLHLLKQVDGLLRDKGFCVHHIDAVIIAQAPKLAPYIPRMQVNISDALGIEEGRVNIKASTPEHTGPEGNMECITARSVASIV